MRGFSLCSHPELVSGSPNALLALFEMLKRVQHDTARLLLITYIAIISASITYAVEKPDTSSVKSRINLAVKEYVSTGFLNATFMFADKDNTLNTGAKGMASLNGKPLEPNQKMPVALGTKPITAVAILRLYDKGLLDIEDKIADFFDKNSDIWPDGKMPVWANSVSIHHLLTHTSGLPEYYMIVNASNKKQNYDFNKDIIKSLAYKHLDFKPGKKYKYSNANFIFLSLIIEKVSGQKLNSFFKKEFFTPLNMKATHLAAVDEAIKIQMYPKRMPYPVRYIAEPTGGKPKFTQVDTKSIEIPYADGMIISNNRDLIRWQKALHQGKILSEKAYGLMITKHYQTANEAGCKSYTGYGIMISKLENGDIMLHHSGKGVGVRTEMGYIPSKNLYFSILSNIEVKNPEMNKDKIDLMKPENRLDIIYFREAILKACFKS